MEESLNRLYGEEERMKGLISDLTSVIKENNHLAKDIFQMVIDAHACVSHTYNSLTQKEMFYIRDSIEPTPTPFDPHRTYHLGHMCELLSKYLNSIDGMKHTKDVYKEKIMGMVKKMFVQMEHIANYKYDTGLVSQGQNWVHHIHLDDIVELRTLLEVEYSSRPCKDIKEIDRSVRQYHKIILDKLNKYIELIQTRTSDSPDFTKIIYQIRVYRILYHNLLLFVKHYRQIRKELLITCGKDEKNRKYLVKCLSNMEDVLRIEEV